MTDKLAAYIDLMSESDSLHDGAAPPTMDQLDELVRREQTLWATMGGADRADAFRAGRLVFVRILEDNPGGGMP